MFVPLQNWRRTTVTTLCGRAPRGAARLRQGNHSGLLDSDALELALTGLAERGEYSFAALSYSLRPVINATG